MPMRKGTTVTWKYGTGTASGKIEEVHKESVTKKIKGSDITRNGTAENPAFVIVQENGDKVVKLQSEVTAATKKK
ncbi:HVA1 family protein [Hymenobacter sp. HDW8]|nr:HVA1 family protein [Hymenobacter sp. HDW8]